MLEDFLVYNDEDKERLFFESQKKLSSYTVYFQTGFCMGRTLISAIKAGTLSSRIKVLEPVVLYNKKRNPTGSLNQSRTMLNKKISREEFKRTQMEHYSTTEKMNKKSLFSGFLNRDKTKTFKEFYIPSESNSLYYLKTKLCVACNRGFEIVDLDTLSTQGLLDPDDIKLKNVLNNETLKAMQFFKIFNGHFFLCFNLIGFFVDRFGTLILANRAIHWLGNPSHFKIFYPYILAINDQFIEIYSLENCQLYQVIQLVNSKWIDNKNGLGFVISDYSNRCWSIYSLDLNLEHQYNKTFFQNIKSTKVAKRKGIVGINGT